MRASLRCLLRYVSSCRMPPLYWSADSLLESRGGCLALTCVFGWIVCLLSSVAPSFPPPIAGFLGCRCFCLFFVYSFLSPWLVGRELGWASRTLLLFKVALMVWC